MSNNWGRAWLAGAAAAVTMAMPAFAHPGSHNTMSFTELAAHLATGWHLAALLGAGTLATAVVLTAVNRGRQARAARGARNRWSGS
jgi:hypothetical protein